MCVAVLIQIISYSFFDLRSQQQQTDTVSRVSVYSLTTNEWIEYDMPAPKGSPRYMHAAFLINDYLVSLMHCLQISLLFSLCVCWFDFYYYFIYLFPWCID